ncbi:MAG: ATP synthase subunit I [Deltaproteobacteria bacterium]
MIRKVLRGDLDETFMLAFRAANLFLTSILVFGALIVASPRMACGILVGAVVATVNCIGLERDCWRVVRMRTLFAYYGGLAVRLGAVTLAVSASLLVLSEYVSPVGLFIGLSVTVVNFYILVAAVLVNRARTKEAV